MNDTELDDKIRQLLAKVVDSNPESPPFPFSSSDDGVGGGPSYIAPLRPGPEVSAGRRRWWITAAAAAVVVLALAGLMIARRSNPTATTDSPPAPVVKDACGNVVSDLTSRVTGLDAATGRVRWTTLVPSGTNLVTEGPEQLRAVANYEGGQDTIIDAATGHEVSTAQRQSTPQMGSDVNSGSLLYGNQQIPASVKVNGVTIQTNQQTGIEPDKVLIQAQDQTGHVVWRTVLEDDSSQTGVGRPLAFGDTVVVSITTGIPSCSLARG